MDDVVPSHSWRRYLVALMCALLLLWYLASLLLGKDAPGALPDGRHAMQQPLPKNFEISGDVHKALTPGSGESVDLTFHNRGATAVTVTTLRAHVRSVDAPNADRKHPCTAADYGVEVPSTIDLALNGSASASLSERGFPPTAWPRVGMLNTSLNQDGCKGASLRLSYSGSGRTTR